MWPVHVAWLPHSMAASGRLYFLLGGSGQQGQVSRLARGNCMTFQDVGSKSCSRLCLVLFVTSKGQAHPGSAGGSYTSHLLSKQSKVPGAGGPGGAATSSLETVCYTHSIHLLPPYPGGGGIQPGTRSHLSLGSASKVPCPKVCSGAPGPVSSPTPGWPSVVVGSPISGSSALYK